MADVQPRTRWTDERIDDFVYEMREFRTEVRAEFRHLRGELADMRRWFLGMWLTTTLGFTGLIVEAALRAT